MKEQHFVDPAIWAHHSGWCVDDPFQAAFFVCSGKPIVAWSAVNGRPKFFFESTPEMSSLAAAYGNNAPVPVMEFVHAQREIERAIACKRLPDPAEIVSPYVYEGATVLELGPGHGYFTKCLLQLVGPSGRVVALDVRREDIDRLKRRAAKFGFANRLDARVVAPDLLGIVDLRGSIDFTFAFAMVHEVGTPARLFSEVAAASKPGALLLVGEPKKVVRLKKFEAEVQAATQVGFKVLARPTIRQAYAVLLKRGNSFTPYSKIMEGKLQVNAIQPTQPQLGNNRTAVESNVADLER